MQHLKVVTPTIKKIASNYILNEVGSTQQLNQSSVNAIDHRAKLHDFGEDWRILVWQVEAAEI